MCLASKQHPQYMKELIGGNSYSSIWEINLKDEKRLEKIEQFLAQGGDPNEPKYINEFHHLLFIEKAVTLRDIEAIKLLSQHNADSTEGESLHYGAALRFAASLGYEDVCHLLIRYGAKVDEVGYGTLLPGFLNIPYAEVTPLLWAAERGHSGIVRLLLENGAEPNIILDPIPMYGELRTPIGAAAKGGHLECVRALVEGGADVNFMHSLGYSALHEAITNSRLDVFTFLVENGADIHRRGSVYGATPLWLARDTRRRRPSQESREIQVYLEEQGGLSRLYWWAYLVILAIWIN